MPPLPKVKRATPQNTANPRIPLNVDTGSIEAAQISRTAANALAQTSTATADIATTITQVGTQLMEPFEKLLAAREVTNANSLVTSSILDIRRRLTSLQTDPDITADKLFQSADEAINEVVTEALGKAEQISPAVREFVNQRLQTTRVNELSTIQRVAVRRDVTAQRAAFQQCLQFFRQEFFRESDPKLRTQHLVDLNKHLDLLTASSIFTNEENVRIKSNVDKFIATNTGIALAATDLSAGIDFIRQSDLTPDEKREGVNAAINRARQDLTIQKAAEADAADELERSQSLTFTTLEEFVLDPDRTGTELSQLLPQIPSLERIGSLKGSDARTTQRLIRVQLNALATQEASETSRTKSITEDNAAAATFLEIIATDVPPKSDEVILQCIGRGGNVNTCINLGRESKNLRLANHYTRRPVYKDLLNRLKSSDPTQGTFTLFSSGESIRKRIVSEAILQVNDAIRRIDPKGVEITNDAIRKFFNTAQENLDASLSQAANKLTVKPILGSFEQLIELRRKRPELANDPFFRDEMRRALAQFVGLPVTTTTGELLEALNEKRNPKPETK